MSDTNIVIMHGRLTRDPEHSVTPNGHPCCEFSLASNRIFKNKTGEQIEEVCFTDIRAWNRLAETCSEFLTKGQSVLVVGRLKLDSWESSDKQKHSKLRIVASSVQFGPKSQGKGAAHGSAQEAEPDPEVS